MRRRTWFQTCYKFPSSQLMTKLPMMLFLLFSWHEALLRRSSLGGFREEHHSLVSLYYRKRSSHLNRAVVNVACLVIPGVFIYMGSGVDRNRSISWIRLIVVVLLVELVVVVVVVAGLVVIGLLGWKKQSNSCHFPYFRGGIPCYMTRGI